MMSKMPIRASSPAAVVCGMPWSWAAGMKWVPIRPLVDQPQIQKVRNSAQKVQRRLTCAQGGQRRAAAPGPERSTGGSTYDAGAP